MYRQKKLGKIMKKGIKQMNKKVIIGIAVGVGVLLTAAAAIAGGIAYTNKQLGGLRIDSVDDVEN
jgi:hypothetical protein